MNRLCCGVAGVLALCGSVYADSVDVVSVRDNTLFMDATGSLSSGAGAYMFSGVNSGSEVRHAVVQFDLSSAVPAGAVVTGVTLTLHCSRTVVISGTFDVHRVTASWGEGASDAGNPGGQGAASLTGDATWLHRSFPNVLWTNPGGDFVSTASSSKVIGGIGFNSWSDGGLIADVQGWVDNPASNFGWLIRNSTGDVRNTRRFDTHENADPNVRPMLHVVFTPPAGCVADVDDGTMSGTPDGGVTIDDLLYYLVLFESGDSRADVDDGTATGTRDGGVTIDDLLYFLQRFSDGC